MALVLLAVLVVGSLLMRPRARGAAPAAPGLLARPAAERPPEVLLTATLRDLLRRDPVEGLRSWWRRRPGRDATDDDLRLLTLLEAVGAALRAGLGAGAAVRIVLEALPDDPAPGPVDDLRRRLGRATADGLPLGPVWVRWAESSGGSAAGFVAAAWDLSDRTGAPLADAVDRGAARVRHARARRGRVAALTAGSRATVTLLTALPLAGPLLGAVYGVGPGELYLASPLVAGSVAAGLALLAGGRTWCRRLLAAEQVSP